jgi:hypothetical protein
MNGHSTMSNVDNFRQLSSRQSGCHSEGGEDADLVALAAEAQGLMLDCVGLHQDD